MFLVPRNKRSNFGIPNAVKTAPKHQNYLCTCSVLLGEGSGAVTQFIRRLSAVRRMMVESIERNSQWNRDRHWTHKKFQLDKSYKILCFHEIQGERTRIKCLKNKTVMKYQKINMNNDWFSHPKPAIATVM